MLGFIQNISAQVYPVQVVPTVLSPYSSKLSDYSNAMVNRINLQLISTDVLMNRREVDLRLKIQGNGITAQSSVILNGARPIYLNGGEIQSLSSAELAAYFRYDNLQGISTTQYSNPLPDGIYTICFQVFDKLTQKVLSSSGCATIYLMLNDPPILNLPSNKEEIALSDFPNIIFSWTPRQLNATNVSYSFELKEILDPSMDPSFAFEVSRSLYKQEDLRSTTLVYDINKPNLLPGKRYAWRVRAISTSGLGENSVFKNNGYSQVYSFTYTSSCSAPRFLLSEQQSNNRVKILWQGENSQQRYHVQYRKSGVNNAEWFDQHTVNTQTMLSNLEPGFTYDFRVGASCTTTSYGVEPSYTYSSIQTFSIDAQNNATAYNCGIVPDLKVSNMQPLGGLVINETFMAGDFPVKVMDVSGSNGVFSGTGYIKVPYLFDTKIAVEFLNVEINTDYQLIRGVVETTYDPDWSNVDFIDDLVDTNQKEEKVPFEIAGLPEGITIDPNTGEIVVKAEDGSTETFPGGKDTVITDSENNIYYVDKDGKVSGPTKQAEGGKPSPDNTDGVDKNGEVKEFTAKGISITFASETLFDTVEYKKALTKDYKKVGGDYLPFKGVINGKQSSVLAKVHLTDNSIAIDSLVFKTSAGAKIDATRIANTNDFELTVKGTQSNAIEEVQVSIKQGEKYKVAGAFKLVHMNTHTVELRLVPTSSSIDIDNVSKRIQEIYEQVGVTVNIATKPIFDISTYLENNQLPTVKDDKLSTYSDAQQRLFTDYQSKNALDKAYYLFVTDKASSTGVEGYMRLNGQYGFVFNAINDKEVGRTAAHEFGHGAFRLEHPFVEYKKDLKQGDTNSLMDYQTTSTSFIYTHWRQINDPKLKLYAFQSQSEGALGGAYDIAPNGKKIFVKTHYIYYREGIKVPVGTLPGFVIKDKEYYYWNAELNTYVNASTNKSIKEDDKTGEFYKEYASFSDDDAITLHKEVGDCKAAFMFVTYSEIKGLKNIPNDLALFFDKNYSQFTSQKFANSVNKAGVGQCSSKNTYPKGVSSSGGNNGNKYSKGDSTVYNYTTEISEEIIDTILDGLISSDKTTGKDAAAVKRVLFITKNEDQVSKDLVLKEIEQIKNSEERIVYLWLDLKNVTSDGKFDSFDIASGGSRSIPARIATNDFERFLASVQYEIFGDYYFGSPENPFKLIFDGIAHLISQAKIPARFYDPTVSDYNPILYKYYGYTTKAQSAPELAKAILEEIKLPKEPGVEELHLIFAYQCGIWNGIVEQIGNIASAGSLLSQGVEMIFNKEMQEQFNSAYQGWKTNCDTNNKSSTYAGCAWDMILKGIEEAHTKGSTPQIAQQYGKTTVDVATLAISFTKVGKLATVNKFMEALDPLNQVMKYAGKGVGVTFKLGSKTVKGAFVYSLEKLHFFSKYKLSIKFNNSNLYSGIPIPEINILQKGDLEKKLNALTEVELDKLPIDENGIRLVEIDGNVIPIGPEGKIDELVSIINRTLDDVKLLLKNSPDWVKNNTELLQKLRDKSDDFIAKVDDFYRNTMNKQTPAGFDGGEKLYNGVWFNKYGFPDFEKMGQTIGNKYNFKGAKGNYTDDFTNARDWLKKQVGIEEIKDLAKGSPLLVKIKGKWEKITWHHHEDGKTLIPVFSDIHSKTSHTGGVKTIELKINNLFNYE